MQQTEEFRDSYRDIDKRIDELLDKLDLIEQRLLDIESRVNTNRSDDEN
tara:strand:- start:235 stop:381 length:147 start_codon:yes stop_codon:yes gene_type:complete